jgi:hypothetical protein
MPALTYRQRHVRTCKISWESPDSGPYLLGRWIRCHHDTVTAVLVLEVGQLMVQLLCYKGHERAEGMESRM